MRVATNADVCRQVDWQAVQGQTGTMISLALFLLLLVPVRVPTLALTTGEAVDFDKVRYSQGFGSRLLSCTRRRK